MNISLLMGLMIAVPLIAAVLVAFCGRNPNLRETISLAVGAVLLLVVLALGAADLSDSDNYLVLAEPFPGLELALSAEPLGVLFALVAGFLWPVTTLYAIGYMRAEKAKNQTRFYCAFAIAISATMGIAMSANMLTLFVFYELLTLSTYPLVTHQGHDDAKRAGRVYLGILLATSMLFMLPAMIWTWQLTGTLDFQPGGILTTELGVGTLSLLLLLYIFGTGKAALMPFHRWLPAAMVAPTPVSALLHAVAVVKAGVFTVLKIVIYLFGLETIKTLEVTHFLAYLAGFTILAASIVAMTRDNLKKRLAYSTVSQLGYVVMGALLGVATGVLGSSMHIVMHAFAKITLFFCAGAILVAVHKTDVSQLNGLGRRMPLTMAAFLIASLSIIGLPPMGGTWSKWLLLQGTLDSGLMVLTAVLLISSLLNLIYLLSIPVRAFFLAPTKPLTVPHTAPPTAAPATQQEPVVLGDEAPRNCLIAISITALACLILFFVPDLLFEHVGAIPL
ncbi:MAG: proton-conducting transporter membrane subunit [Motiliproteus sp.]|nr:proton-conducting transporter membrane subunit [Motiliproteus sp.]MCW9051599.1 proton-conducting transporter membrane subunit [Motiliproteus sp.]